MRVAFHTLGCRSNFADTLELQAGLISAGSEPTVHAAEAEVIVVNSCSVTDEADRETLRTIRRLRRENPAARLIVTGCMAEVGREKLLATGEVQSVIGPADKRAILRKILDESDLNSLDSNARVSSIDLAGEFNLRHVGPGARLGDVTTRSRFHLRIQDGCENHCTFCIVPSTRGELRSRDAQTVVEDLRRLRERGFREVVFSGTHLGGWGEEKGENLLELLRRVNEMGEDIGLRVRLSSLDPNDLSHEIIDLVGQSHIFCKHLHICLQALSERVLKRMNRRYSLREGVELLNYVASNYPRITIGSDIITGFPGETREEVAEQLELFDALPLSYLHVFPYSERQNTAALRLDGHIEAVERKRRAARWRAVADRRWTNYLRSFVGRELVVVVENGEIHGKQLSADKLLNYDGRVFSKATSDEFLPVALSSHTDQGQGPLTAGSKARVLAIDLAAVDVGAVSSVEGGERVVCELLSLEN